MIRLLIAACESISMDSDKNKSTGEKHRWNIHYDAAYGAGCLMKG